MKTKIEKSNFYKRRRNQMDKKTQKNKKKQKDFFVCEICGCITPIECEGTEPKTCAYCMPPADLKF